MNSPPPDVIAFYEPLRGAESAARRVGWRSDELHELRLRALLHAVGPIHGVGRIIDAGCGEGRLLPLLRAAGFQGQYVGEDVLPHMVERAVRHHHGETFVVTDSMDSDGLKADAILCSGTLNTMDTHDTGKAFCEALSSLWERTEGTLAVDFTTRGQHSSGALIASYDVGDCLRIARTLTPRVRLLEDVLPGEAILVLSRTNEFALDRLPGTEHLALAKAEIFLRERTPRVAREKLLGATGVKASIIRALADAQLGRVRDAEKALHELAATSDEAKLHLALLLLATRRIHDGITHLLALRAEGGTEADAARFQLIIHGEDESIPEPESLLEEITDPWIRREALALLDARR